MEDKYTLELQILELEEKLNNKKTKIDCKFQKVYEAELKRLKERLQWIEYYDRKWEDDGYGM